LCVGVWQLRGARMDTQPAVTHSGIGIASFIVSVLALVILIAAFAVITVSVTSAGVDKRLEVGAGLAIAITWLLNLIGLGLGIAGAAQKGSKKVFSVLGIVFSAATILVSVAVIVLGYVMKA
jgi:hypothetical protein